MKRERITIHAPRGGLLCCTTTHYATAYIIVLSRSTTSGSIILSQQIKLPGEVHRPLQDVDLMPPDTYYG